MTKESECQERKEKQMISIKKDKKDEIIEQMQTRSTELMSENSRLQRDLTNGLEEITKVRQ